MQSGVYKILNRLDGSSYIGSSANLKRRKHEHFVTRKCSNTHLQYAISKYGKHNFNFEVLEYCREDKLVKQEQFWIDKHKKENNRLYNILNCAGTVLGLRWNHTKTAKQKISKALSGKKKSEDHVKAVALSQTGKPGHLN